MQAETWPLNHKTHKGQRVRATRDCGRRRIFISPSVAVSTSSMNLRMFGVMTLVSAQPLTGQYPRRVRSTPAAEGHRPVTGSHLFCSLYAHFRCTRLARCPRSSQGFGITFQGKSYTIRLPFSSRSAQNADCPRTRQTARKWQTRAQETTCAHRFQPEFTDSALPRACAPRCVGTDETEAGQPSYTISREDMFR